MAKCENDDKKLIAINAKVANWCVLILINEFPPVDTFWLIFRVFLKCEPEI